MDRRTELLTQYRAIVKQAVVLLLKGKICNIVAKVTTARRKEVISLPGSVIFRILKSFSPRDRKRSKKYGQYKYASQNLTSRTRRAQTSAKAGHLVHIPSSIVYVVLNCTMFRSI